MQSFLKWFGHPICTVGLLLLLAGGAAVGTFVESAHGPQAGYATVYDAWWFEALWLTTVIHLLLVMWRHLHRWGLLALHLSFLILLLGGSI